MGKEKISVKEMEVKRVVIKEIKVEKPVVEKKPAPKEPKKRVFSDFRIQVLILVISFIQLFL
jgi:hypothetical protein